MNNHWNSILFMSCNNQCRNYESGFSRILFTTVFLVKNNLNLVQKIVKIQDLNLRHWLLDLVTLFQGYVVFNANPQISNSFMNNT